MDALFVIVYKSVEARTRTNDSTSVSTNSVMALEKKGRKICQSVELERNAQTQVQTTPVVSHFCSKGTCQRLLLVFQLQKWLQCSQVHKVFL